MVCFLQEVTRDRRNLVERTLSTMPEKLQSIDNERFKTEHVEQDDPGLVSLIRHDFLEQPSLLQYNLKNEKLQEYSQGGQSKYLDTLFNQKVSTRKSPKYSDTLKSC